jgi:hypothetical protein
MTTSSTPEQLAKRARWQLAFTLVSLALTVLTVIVPAWIESVTAFEPDGGSGELEWLLAAAPGMVGLVFGGLWFRTRHQLAAIRLS